MVALDGLPFAQTVAGVQVRPRWNEAAGSTHLASESIGTFLVYSLIGNHIKKGIMHVTTMAAMVSIGNCRKCDGGCKREVQW